ncbi:nuclear transport factor 2 family protein [Sphingosinicella ginsenosidimutans]|uniref:Nuclear transport factor 2 family protein n=1 Tax=Allosphingosinicella ginsenosidimutans TaxID=1176539 RepID=A0A5C6TVN9_9SPHN|nr:nuclear transport factor 2 family protein [Sphingosinicella ginsenosidimutans]TXC64021.1 nuclear transport factor 2 family protein [Sphingosinicella ginsenosidimutans]
MSTLEQLSDRHEIADLLVRYARAVDRCDLDLLIGVWAPGAIVDYGSGEVDAAEWSRGLLDRLLDMDRTQHALSNSLVALDGDRATAETVCTAYHRFRAEAGWTRMVVGGRYLDRLIRTEAGWRIEHRRYVMDWNETETSTMETEGRFARFTRVGLRAPDDASYF